MEKIQLLIDRLRSSMTSNGAVGAASTHASSSAPAGERLRFAKGDRVIDLATGEPGVVTLARRDSALNNELFYVQLAGARLVTRGPDELVLDRPASPASNM